MFYSIKNREFLENLEELVFLKNQVEEVRLQDKLGKQKFHEDMKEIYEPLTDTIKDTSEIIAKTMLISKGTNKTLENLNDTFLEIMLDRGIISFLLLSPLSKITNRKNTSQFKLVKDYNSNRNNDLLIHNTIPVILYFNLLTFRETDKEFELKGDILKMITNKNYNVDLASLSDKKIGYDFAKVKYFDVKSTGNISTRDISLIRLLKSQGSMVSASGVSSFSQKNSSSTTIFLWSDPNEFCDRIKLLLQEKQAGNNSDKINEKFVAKIIQFLEYKCTSKKHHKQILNKCNLSHTKNK